MALRVNNTEITKVVYNGKEMEALRFNGTGYFGKAYSLMPSASTGVNFTIARNSSPNQNAICGNINQSAQIYYGDELTIQVKAVSGYINPKLYVDIGDGNGFMIRSSPFSFTVTRNIMFYGTAEVQSTQSGVLWSGSKQFMSTGNLDVPGISASDKIMVTATVEIIENSYDPYEDSWDTYTLTTRVYNNQALPLSYSYGNASMSISVKDGAIQVECNYYESSFKGFVTIDVPRVTITEVRR